MFYSMNFLKTSRVLFPLWIVIGIAIYFLYGYRKVNRSGAKKTEEKSENIAIEENIE